MNPLYPQMTQMFYGNCISGNTCQSSSGFLSDIYHPLAYTDLQHLHNSPFIPRPSVNAPSLCGSQSSHALLTDCSEESREVPWDADLLQEFLDVSENVPARHTQLEGTGCAISPNNQPKRINWQEEHVVSVEDAMDSDWSKILSKVDKMNPKPKVCFSFCHCLQ